MPGAWQTVRVFISSTFRDMQAERDWLVKRVFPTLRHRLEGRRIHLVDIDLRWGITREQADNDQVLGLCLQQIDDCRPFFIGLLGERYGWVPSKIPEPVGKQFGLAQLETQRSLTELEILHGVLNEPSMRTRALFCFRSEAFLAGLDDARRRIYVESPTDEELQLLPASEAANRAASRHRRLVELKAKIRRLSPPISLLDGYPCRLNPELPDPISGRPGRIDGLEEFGKWVITQLEQAIILAPEFQKHLAAVAAESRDELEDERDFHERFIENRTRVYVGRPALNDALNAFVTGDAPGPCLVTGPSGSGKSAALAQFCKLTAIHPPSATTLIAHFVGASPRSTSVRDVLRHLCAELNSALKLTAEIKQDVRDLSGQFRELLATVPPDRRVVLVLDALDQLDEDDDAHSFHWLPMELPTQVRLLVSCLDDSDRVAPRALTTLRRRQPHEIKIGRLTDDERRGILREVPSVAAKTLDEQQVKLLLTNDATRNPLFLLVALEELRGFGSFEQLNERIAGLPHRGDTLTALFQQVIRRLGGDFDAPTVEETLRLLACARRGLSERELLDLVESRSVPMEESASDLFPILRQLRPYLQSRGPLLDFFHRHLATATREECFNRVTNPRPATHQKLAGYFQGLADPQGDQTWLGAQGRPFGELVFHLAGARLEDALCSTLSDLKFLTARCRHDQVFDLPADYRLAREALPEAQEELEQEQRHDARTARWTEAITGYAHQWNERRDRLARGEAVVAAEPQLPEPIPSERPWSDQRLEAEGQRMAGNPTRLDRLRAFAEFVEAESYRLAEFGRRPGFLAQHAFNHAPAGPVHEVAAGLTSTESVPLLLRRWGADRVINPRPALLRVLAGHTGDVECVSVTPDGRRALSGASDKTLRLWDLESGRCLRVLAGHDRGVRTVSVTPDARFGLSGSVDTTVRFWDLESGQCLQTLSGHGKWVRSVDLTPDGRRGVSASMDNTVRVWDLESGLCLKSLTGHTDWVLAVNITPDGRRALSGSRDRTLRLWDLESGSCLRELSGHAWGLRGASLTPDGRRGLSGGEDITLRVWDLDTGQCLRMLTGAHLEEKSMAAIMDRIVGRVFDPTGHTAEISCVALLPDGRLAVSAASDGTMRVWDLEKGNCLRTIASPSHVFTSLGVTPDGRRAVSAGHGSNILVWDLMTGRNLPSENLAGDSVSAVAATPDGRRAVSGHADYSVRVWDPGSGHRLRTLAGHKKEVGDVGITSDGVRAALIDNDSLRVWNLESGQCLHTCDVRSARRLSITPDGRLALLAFDSNKLAVWNLEDGTHVRTFEDLGRDILDVSMTPDGRLAATAQRDAIRLWSVERGECLATMSDAAAYNSSVCVTANGARAISGSSDGRVFVWNLPNGHCEFALSGHTRHVSSVAVMPDGRRCVSAGLDGTIRLWNLEDGACLSVHPEASPLRSVAVFGPAVGVCTAGDEGKVVFLEGHGH